MFTPTQIKSLDEFLGYILNRANNKADRIYHELRGKSSGLPSDIWMRAADCRKPLQDALKADRT
jgi:hypothetical protein